MYRGTIMPVLEAETLIQANARAAKRVKKRRSIVVRICGDNRGASSEDSLNGWSDQLIYIVGEDAFGESYHQFQSIFTRHGKDSNIPRTPPACATHGMVRI